MSFNVTCPQCGNEFRRVKDKYAGKRMRCKCGVVFRAPRLPEPTRKRRSTKKQLRNDFDVPELDDVEQPVESSRSLTPVVPDFSLEGVDEIANSSAVPPLPDEVVIEATLDDEDDEDEVEVVVVEDEDDKEEDASDDEDVAVVYGTETSDDAPRQDEDFEAPRKPKFEKRKSQVVPGGFVANQFLEGLGVKVRRPIIWKWVDLFSMVAGFFASLQGMFWIALTLISMFSAFVNYAQVSDRLNAAQEGGFAIAMIVLMICLVLGAMYAAGSVMMTFGAFNELSPTRQSEDRWGHTVAGISGAMLLVLYGIALLAETVARGTPVGSSVFVMLLSISPVTVIIAGVWRWLIDQGEELQREEAYQDIRKLQKKSRTW